MTDTVLISVATAKALEKLNRAQEAHAKNRAEVLRLEPLPRQGTSRGQGYSTTYSDACGAWNRSGRAVEWACDDLVKAAKANEPPHLEVQIPSEGT